MNGAVALIAVGIDGHATVRGADAPYICFQATIRERKRTNPDRTQPEQTTHPSTVVRQVGLVLLVHEARVIHATNANLRRLCECRIRVLNLRSAHEADNLV